MFPIQYVRYFGKIYSYYFKFNLGVTLRHTDMILYNSEQTKDDTEMYFPKAKKIPSCNAYIISNPLTRYVPPKDENYFLYVGNMEKRKGVDILIKAYRRYREEGGTRPLILAGKMQEDDIEQLLETALTEVEGLTYLGYVSHTTRYDLYNNCSCFVFPSMAEGFGMPILEVMKHNKPILASNLKIFNEVVGDCVERFSLAGDDDDKVISLANGMKNIDKKINSGTKITQGSKVTFTAEPEEGYIVSGWKVDGKTYKWQDKDEDYLGTTLVLEDISKDENVIVSFKKSTASYKVITSVADEDGKTDTSLAKVTAINAETKEAVTDLTSIKEGTTLTFTASVADKTNHMVKLWQTSKDGKTWEDAALSGGSNTFTLYNISENLYIRSVITIAQKYSLKYKVVLDDGKPSETIVTDKKIAELTATSNGQEITSGDSHSAYIPVEFALTLNNDYYVTGWSKNVKAGEDLSAASLDALDSNTEVVVTIKEKPVVTIPSGISNGTLTVIYKDAANKDISVSNGDHVPNGTQLLVTLTPEKGYVVDEDALGASVETEYTDEDKSGNTTDTKSYKVENVIANVTVKGAFKALGTHKVTYEPVIASGESANGTLTAKADRKQMDIYKIDKLTTGEKVYEGSTLTFTAAPDQDYSVQEWRVNGKVLKEDGIKVTDSTLTIANVEKDYTVTVQFKKSGSDTTIAAGANGKIVSAVAGKVDQIANIETGFVLASGATVDITAQPDTGYKVGCWKVNGKVVDGQTGNTYTYTADENGTGAAITVQFVQIDYAVSWSAVNGTVKAEDTSGTEYEGNKADIRGGSKVTFSATPKEAYKVSCWKVNGKVVDGENANTFTFTVPSGAKETPEVASYKVEAVCEKDQFTLTYAQPSNGTLTARGAAGEVASGD